MKTDLLFVIYTHDRPAVLQTCLNTLFNNTEIKPDHVLISDDYSQPQTKAALFNFCLQNSVDFPINFMSFNKPIYYGWNAEFCQKYIQWLQPKRVVVCESDYILRKGWLEDGLAALEAKPLSVGVSLYSNPDYYQAQKTEEMFPSIMKEDFGEDPAQRQYLHKPQKILTSVGEMKIQFTTNACGSFILNWKRITELVEKYPEIQERVFDRSCNKQPGGDRKYFSDGNFTHGLSFYWYKDVEELGYLDKYFYEKNGPWVDICDFSIGEHLNARGINGGNWLPEGETFVGSPHWSDLYLQTNPRLNIN